MNKRSVYWRKNEPGCLGMIFIILGIILLFLVLHAILSLIVLFAWNIVIPPVLNGPVIDYWQAFFGLWLVRIVLAPLSWRSAKE